MLKIDITGRDGRTLKDAWHAGPRTYLGLQIRVPGVHPHRPGQPSVLCNMPVAIEQHVNWVTDCIRHTRRPPSKPPRPRRQLDRRGQSGGRRHPFAAGQSSWYLGANVPGKPRIFMPYAGGVDRYRTICDEVVKEP